MVTLWDADNKVVINAFNEEEQQEQGKKDQLEEKIISEGNSNFDFLAFSKKSTISNFSKIAQFDYTVEIHLPPPEQPL